MIDQLFTRLAATIASFLAATLVVIAAFVSSSIFSLVERATAS